MFRCITQIQFHQVAKASDGTPRNKSLLYEFVTDFESSNSWTDLTNNAKITIPKNVYVRDANNRLVALAGTQNEKQIDTLFQRGDKVAINYGYWRYDTNRNEFKDTHNIFEGYISKVSSKQPIVLECEDNVWLLKQIPCPPMVWAKNKTVEDLMKLLLMAFICTILILAIAHF